MSTIFNHTATLVFSNSCLKALSCHASWADTHDERSSQIECNVAFYHLYSVGAVVVGIIECDSFSP